MKRGRRYRRGLAVQQLFKEITLLAGVVLVLQVIAFFGFRSRFHQPIAIEANSLPLVTNTIARLPNDVRLLQTDHYAALPFQTTPQFSVTESGIEGLLLDEKLKPLSSFQLPANTVFNSITSAAIDADSLLDIVYTRAWYRNEGDAQFLDSVWFCYRRLSGKEVVLDRQVAPDTSSYWQVEYELPTTSSGDLSASGEKHFALFRHLRNSTERSQSLLLYTRETMPQLVNDVPVAIHPSHGFWMKNHRNEEVFTFGGEPTSAGVLIPVRVIDADGGHQSTVLADNRATLMQVSSEGIVRWIRSFPPSEGEVLPYRSHSDTLFAVHVRKDIGPHHEGGITFLSLAGSDGTIISFRNQANLTFTRFLIHDQQEDDPIGLLSNQDSVFFWQGMKPWYSGEFSAPLPLPPFPDEMRLLSDQNGWLLPVKIGADSTLLINSSGNPQALIFGSLENNPLLSLFQEGVQRPVFVSRDSQGSVLFNLLEPNPLPFWRIRQYAWMLLLMLLPHVVLILLFIILRVRQARRDARDRLLHAYRRLQTRFNRRSHELANANRSLEQQNEERKRVVQELRTHREHLDSIFNSVQNGLVTLNNEGVITRANQAFGQLFSLDPGELPGMELLSLFPTPPESLKLLLDNPTALRSEEDEIQIELLSTRQRERKVVRVRVVPLLQAEETPAEILIVFRDETRLVLLEDQVHARHRFHNLTGQSASMRQVYTMIENVAQSDATVLITGESGTGKELVAKALHHQSHRATGPFVSVHCAALTETLLESELFGHVKGSFTGATRDKVGYFQRAHHGTLFLDEFGEVSSSVQVKLLRVLNDKVIEQVGDTTPIPVDVRILIATNRNLATEVREGRFREDLFYRINVLSIEMPPLRERREDIPLLVSDLLHTICEETGKEVDRIGEDVLARFMVYPWPGNIRELRNCLERAVIVCKDRALTLDHLPIEIRDYQPASDPVTLSVTTTHQSRDVTAPSVDERTTILDALVRNGWVLARTARSLGVSRQTLYRKMEAYQIKRPD